MDGGHCVGDTVLGIWGIDLATFNRATPPPGATRARRRNLMLGARTKFFALGLASPKASERLFPLAPDCLIGYEMPTDTAHHHPTARLLMANDRINKGPDGNIIAAWDGSLISTAGSATVYIEVSGYVSEITIKARINTGDIAIAGVNMATMATALTITGNGLYAFPGIGELSATGIGAAVVNVLMKEE